MVEQLLSNPDEFDFLLETHQQIEVQLAQQDHRYTNSRRQLVEVLSKAGHPMALPNIVAADPALAQSSVYRNLNVLVRSGVIRRINTGGDHAYFELAEPLLAHHHHLICMSCGAIQDIYLTSEVEMLVDRNLAEVALESGFTPIYHNLDLHGHCANC
ncbi:MAG: transcriptional repressor [Acidimicrobiia bacterium]|nr:transcriptional repressor [Acidimicrobiia bacterium]MYC58277.1 transcriptional repressor [Acidimicrobiia bacterium]MYG93947.1 transcriptional repressor [Acidimicrobiia bacterium]MYI30965.1 transcriptional repressor [Acidimicrobiia bacterium]